MPGDRSGEIVHRGKRAGRGRRFYRECGDEFRSRIGDVILPLALFVLTGSDCFAEITRILSIEGLADRFDERRILRLIHDHRDPRDALDSNPVPAHQMKGGEHGEGSGKSRSQTAAKLVRGLCARKRILQAQMCFKEKWK